MEKNAIATGMLKKNHQNILLILNKLYYIKAGLENRITTQVTIKTFEIINKELSQLKEMIEKVNEIQLELSKHLKKIIGQ